MTYEYPTITRRYLSTVVDFLFIITTMIIVSYILQESNGVTGKIRVAIIILLFFAYEPLFTSVFCTIGQKITGIRVRKRGSLEHISILAAYIRIFIKVLLGFISFFTIIFSKDRRAIHDFAAGSVVIYKKDSYN